MWCPFLHRVLSIGDSRRFSPLPRTTAIILGLVAVATLNLFRKEGIGEPNFVPWRKFVKDRQSGRGIKLGVLMADFWIGQGWCFWGRLRHREGGWWDETHDDPDGWVLNEMSAGVVCSFVRMADYTNGRMFGLTLVPLKELQVHRTKYTYFARNIPLPFHPKKQIIGIMESGVPMCREHGILDIVQQITIFLVGKKRGGSARRTSRCHIRRR